MIRTAVVTPRSAARTGFATASVLGIVALAGCAGPATGEDVPATPAPASSAPTTDAGTDATGSASTGAYTDGTYTADGTYVDGGGVSETVNVTITLAGDVVTEVEVTGDAASPQSRQYQEAFIGGISEVVVGQEIDDLDVSRVAGSSLTSGGFNAALEKIKSEAAA